MPPSQLGSMEADLVLTQQEVPRDPEAERRLRHKLEEGELQLQQQRAAAQANEALHRDLLGWGLEG